MHELTLVGDLLSKIEAIAAGERASRVLAVNVRLGALAHISPEHFREHFTRAARGTIAQHARLSVELSEDARDPHAQDIFLDSVTVGE